MREEMATDTAVEPVYRGYCSRQPPLYYGHSCWPPVGLILYKTTCSKQLSAYSGPKYWSHWWLL